MPLSENEMKQIKEEANKWADLGTSIHSCPTDVQVEAYIAGTVAQAEKYQNDIEQWKAAHDRNRI